MKWILKLVIGHKMIITIKDQVFFFASNSLGFFITRLYDSRLSTNYSGWKVDGTVPTYRFKTTLY